LSKLQQASENSNKIDDLSNITKLQTNEIKASTIQPDVSLLIPFKSLQQIYRTSTSTTTAIAIAPTDGASFALPTIIVDLVKRLTAPYCFDVN
jgi:hypothetical protein